MDQNAVASSSRGPAASPPSPSTTTPRPPHTRRPRRNYDPEDRTTKTDVGSTPGTSWTLSSYKPGSGIPELRSPDLSKLWQSDGNQPHLINIQFPRRTCVTHLSIYLDVKQDDSYTPTKISVKAGTNYHDLTSVRVRQFEAPQGWKHFSMTPGTVDAGMAEEEEEGEEGEGEGEGEGEEEGIWVWLLQVCILANHLNGKDTHIRRLVVFGPKSGAGGGGEQNGLKRGATSVLTNVGASQRSRFEQAANGNGGDITLAQLLSVQRQAEGHEGRESEDGDGASDVQRRSALNLFGNIR